MNQDEAIDYCLQNTTFYDLANAIAIALRHGTLTVDKLDSLIIAAKIIYHDSQG